MFVIYESEMALLPKVSDCAGRSKRDFAINLFVHERGAAAVS
jgi:hypothetical protein